MDQAPKTQYVFLNRTFKLWCPAKAAPAPYILWRKDDVTVQNSTSITFQLKVTSENNVNYSCEVRKDEEVLRRDISLTIEGEVLLFCWSTLVLCIVWLSKPVLFYLLKILTTQKKRLSYFGSWILFNLSKVIFLYPFNLICMLFLGLNVNYWYDSYLVKGKAYMMRAKGNSHLYA